MNPTRPPVTRIADSIATAIERRILEGSLKPGDRLPAERELALDMGVSRPSLREALQRLVSKGLLTTRHGGGTFVTDRLEAPFVDPWQEMLDGHPTLQRDLLEFRHMLEAQAAQLAATRATDADLVRIGAAHQALEAAYARDDLPAAIDADVSFHQAVAEASHNVMIGHLSSSLFRVIQGHVSRNLQHLHARPHEWSQLKAQHRAIWHAVRERAPEEAILAARAHIEFVQQSMRESADAQAREHTALRRLGDAGAKARGERTPNDER